MERVRREQEVLLGILRELGLYLITSLQGSRGEESSEITKLPTTKWEVLYLYTVL